MMLWKCCTQYATKYGKLSCGHRTGKGQFSFQSQRKAMPKNVRMLHNCTHHTPGTFSSVQSLSRVRLFATPRTAARQAALSITNFWSLHKLMSIESVMPSNHLILCHPLLLLPSILPSIRVFSKESALCIKWLIIVTWILLEELLTYSFLIII